MAIYDLDKINGWYKDFTSCKNKFDKTYYEDFKDSYIYDNIDDTIKKMKKKLDSHYKRISNGYKKIDTVWKNYINDITNVDKVMAGTKTVGSVKSSTVQAKLKKLPELKVYEDTLVTKAKVVSAQANLKETFAVGTNFTWPEYACTAAMSVTAAYEGAKKWEEYITDSVYYYGTVATSSVVSVFDKEKAKQMQEDAMDYIALDRAGMMTQQKLNTELWQNIQSKSDIKYGDEAYGWSSAIGETGMNLIGCIVCPAGGAAVLGFGYGSGKTAEQSFRQSDRDFYGDGIEITINGAIQAWDNYGTYQILDNASSLYKTIKQTGVKELIEGIFKKSGKKAIEEAGKSAATSKGSKALSFLKKYIVSTFTQLDTYVDPLMASLNNVSYSNEEGWEVDWETMKKDLKINFSINAVVNILGVGFSSKMDNMASKVDIDASKGKTGNVDVNNLKNQYDDIINKWGDDFDYYKNLVLNGGAGDLNKLDEMFQDLQKMAKIEAALAIIDEATDVISDTVDKSSNTIKDTLRDIKENLTTNFKFGSSDNKADIDKWVNEAKKQPIPGFDDYKVNTNSPEYQRAMQDLYSTKSPSGKQVLDANSDYYKLRFGDKNISSANKNNITSKNINKNMKNIIGFKNTLLGIPLSIPATISKMKNVNITSDLNIFNKIKNEGLYHFTNEDAAMKILDSGYIKKSNKFTSYGRERTFAFAGIPSIEDCCLNDVFDYKKVAIKMKVDDSDILNLQYRKYSDQAVSSLGDMDITNKKPEIAYLVLKEQDGKLKYVEVSKVEYDAYDPSFNDNILQKTIYDVDKKIKQTFVGISTEYNNVINGGKQLKEDVFNFFKKTSHSNENKLKQEILGAVNSKYNDIQKIRKTYIELNKRVNYDVNYYLGDDKTKEAIVKKVTNFKNMTNNDIICKGWSELYRESLIDLGFDPNKVRIADVGSKHWWVEIDMDDYIIAADATDALLGSTDLANCKFSESTNGLLILNKADAGNRIKNIIDQNPNALEYSNNYFRSVDKTIDYIGDNGYFSENIERLNKLFSDSSSPIDNIISNTSEKINRFISTEIPKNMNGYDAYAYFRKFSINLFGAKNNFAIPKLKKVDINGKVYSAVEIKINDGNNNYIMTFDEINGKKMYSEDEYFSGPANAYEQF